MTSSSPHINLYTRNGFAGPMATMVRAQYNPPYKYAVGSYTPRRLDLFNVGQSDERRFPVPVLVGDGVSIETMRHTKDMSFAVRNVLADELHFIYAGSATLETDFGQFELVPGDFVLIPRAVTYRIRSISSELVETIIVTPSRLVVEPENAPGVLNVDLHVDAPRPLTEPLSFDGDYEVVLRHGDETTSYFFDYDPLPTLQTLGEPIVRRFNIANVHGLGVTAGGLFPPKLIDDPAAETMLFYIGTRQSERPPVHHNADFDEVIFYYRGPGHYGGLSEPGTVTWTPKGVIHQGPDENVPEGFQAFLIETRAALQLTPAGKEVAHLMETAMFGLHDSEIVPAG